MNTINEQSKNIWDSGELDEQVGFVKFEPQKNNTCNVKFLQADPNKQVNKFGNEQYSFEVLDIDDNTVKTLSVTSKRLMRALSVLRPLEGKDIIIHRHGEGMSTDYTVVEARIGGVQA